MPPRRKRRKIDPGFAAGIVGLKHGFTAESARHVNQPVQHRGGHFRSRRKLRRAALPRAPQKIGRGLAEGFVDRLADRLGRERKSEYECGGGGGVRCGDSRAEQVISQHIRPGDDPRNGHVGRRVRAVNFLVPAVIGSENNGCVFRQGGQDASHGRIGARNFGNVRLRHPPRRMTEVVHVWQMHEHEIESGLDLRDGLIGHVLIAAGGVNVGVH